MTTPENRTPRFEHGTWVEQTQMAPGYDPPSMSLNPNADPRTPNVPGQPTPNESPPNYWPPQPTASTQGLAEQDAMRAPAPRKNRLWLLFAAVGALLIVIAVTVGITLAAQTDTKTAGNPATQTGWEGEPNPLDNTPAAEPTTEPAPTATPQVKDIALTAKITEKKCYGYGAGCNVGFNIDAEYVGPVLSPDDTWLVTYEVTGIEDGPLIGSLTMTGDQYTSNPEFVGTKSSKSRITIKVTSVEKVGI